MTPALVGLAVQVVILGGALLLRPWRDLDSDELAGGFPVGPAAWMGTFGAIGMSVVVGAQVLHLLIGWPGLTYSDWEGLL